MPVRKYNLQSWLDPRIDIRPSPIGGRGMFAREPIKKGETVIVWGGVVLTAEDIKAERCRKGTLSAIDEKLWLGDPPDGEDYAADFTNHACDPNLWLSDEVTLTARRDIAAGEELTADYMMWEANEDYQAAWQCRCGSPLCRKSITGRDWRLPALQARYKDHLCESVVENYRR